MKVRKAIRLAEQDGWFLVATARFVSSLAAAAYRGDSCQDNLSHNRSSR